MDQKNRQAVTMVTSIVPVDITAITASEEGAGLLTAMYGRQPASLVLAMESTS